MVYSYIFSKVIDDPEITIKDVQRKLGKIADESGIGAFEFRNGMFCWESNKQRVFHDGVVVSFWSQYMISDEALDTFAMKLNEVFPGAKTCYLTQYVDGAIINVFPPDDKGDVKIDRITSK